MVEAVKPNLGEILVKRGAVMNVWDGSDVLQMPGVGLRVVLNAGRRHGMVRRRFGPSKEEAMPTLLNQDQAEYLNSLLRFMETGEGVGFLHERSVVRMLRSWARCGRVMAYDAMMTFAMVGASFVALVAGVDWELPLLIFSSGLLFAVQAMRMDSRRTYISEEMAQKLFWVVSEEKRRLAAKEIVENFPKDGPSGI